MYPSQSTLIPSLAILSWAAILAAGDAADAVFVESNGVVAVEAEAFFRQARDNVRKFHLTSSHDTPNVAPDGDPSHAEGASGNTYMEILPDTRRTHADRLVRGENFMPEAGKMAVLSYRVRFQTPGRYYVWVRAYSTGGEDNGLHVGMDGTWPASGQRLQWCDGKNSWRWESKQRTEKVHCGEAFKIFLDIPEPGDHVIEFSMREDGFEFDKWLMTTNRDFARPLDAGPVSQVAAQDAPTFRPAVTASGASGIPAEDRKGVTSTKPIEESRVDSMALVEPRQPNGQGALSVDGELKVWHNVTLTLDGPFAHENDKTPNPFTDYRFDVTFEDEEGAKYVVPGYFAADGNAANTSAAAGTKWRAHFAPNREGEWKYTIAFRRGEGAVTLPGGGTKAEPFKPFHGRTGKFQIAATDKSGRDLRGHGWLKYVGKHYLQFAGSGKYFLKAGADAPETLLAFADFDNTQSRKPGSPLKSWSPHVRDWKPGDPGWQEGKGKGLIGAVNYLSSKGCNAFSFLTYNAGGDGDNVWPFVDRDDPLHYDCSKLDQWGIVFEHATRRGMYLHFKLQETENDDNRHKNTKVVPESLDGGKLGPERRLYFRELIARFGHNLALNWNLGEENTQSTDEITDSLAYITGLDAYGHNRVLHTYPGQQDEQYGPFLGRDELTGLSLQNSHIRDTHSQTVKWVEASRKAGKPWIVAFDESGSAAHGQCPDLGYRGFDGHDADGKMVYTEHEVRKQTLWGHLLGGGAGVEYYFGYKFAENDLKCEDWRSRDRSWDYCRIALDFFHDNEIRFWEMINLDDRVGNPKHDNSVYCLGKPGSVYLVYLPKGPGKDGSDPLDLTGVEGEFSLHWFNPREGGDLLTGSSTQVVGGQSAQLGSAPEGAASGDDWLAVIRAIK